MALLFSGKIFAATDICDTLFRSPNLGCTDLSTSHSSGGSYPLLFDAFNFNPSALPTFPTPIGLEAYYDQNKLNIAILKGINNAGFGASAKNTDTTFFSGVENYKVALKKNIASTYTTSKLDKNYNIGTALSFLNLAKIINFPIGLNYRYNSAKKIWSFNPGFEIRTKILTTGLAYFREKPQKYHDGFYDVQEQIDNISFNSGLKLGNLLLDYSMIAEKNTSRYYFKSGPGLIFESSYTVITQIFSGIYINGPVSLTAAFRKQNNSQLQGNYASNVSSKGITYSDHHALLGITYKGGKTEVGAFYNYVLTGDISMLFKIFF